MTQSSRPFNGTVTGDAGPYSDQEWHEAWRNTYGFGASDANVGPVKGNDDGTRECLWVRANSPAAANVIVSPGAALVRGIHYLNTADVTLAIAANASGNPRIDVIVLEADFTAQTVRLDVVQGTPAASPVAPALTQTDGVLWQIPLADVAVANGFTSIAQSNIRPNAHFANLADGVYLDNVLNNSGVLLETGDVVIVDTSTNRAVTTTTTVNNSLVTGVWVGRTASGARGRVQMSGIGLIYVNGAVASRNTALTTSGTARQAAVSANGWGRVYEIARSLETTSGAGLCLARIGYRVFDQNPIFTQTATRTISNTTTETSLFTTGVGTLTLPANMLAVGKSLRIKLAGLVTTTGVNAPLRLYLGGVLLATSDTLNFASITDRAWHIDVLLTCRSTGATGTVIAQGIFWYQVATVAINGLGLAMTGTGTVDTTTALAIDLTAQWSAASASHSLRCTNAVVEVLENAA